MAARGTPLVRDQWDACFEQDGRLIKESVLRSTVFRGGIDPALRKEVWYFLLGYYPMHSTSREREVLQKERRVEYLARKQRWQEVLEPEEHQTGDEFADADDLDPGEQFIFINAKLTAMRLDLDEDRAKDSIRTIRKDVPRTDREMEYFAEDDSIHLQWLHDILVTWAVYHGDVGYVQGMNDVLAMILVVMDHEADAFWCFSQYLDTIQSDFKAKGMIDKIEQLRTLLTYLEPDLMAYLRSIDAGDMIYCHRWLLLGFKREFVFADSLRLFEISCSHHLELSSVDADRVRADQLRKERERILGSQAVAHEDSTSAGEDITKAEGTFTFELFVSCAILQQQKERIMKCGDMADVFQLINGLTEKMDLDEVLQGAEVVFYEYCRRSVSNSAAATINLLKGDL